MNKVATPNFDMMAQEGVRVPYINYTFIAKTFPCHFTIATGKRAVLHTQESTRKKKMVVYRFGQKIWNLSDII